MQWKACLIRGCNGIMLLASAKLKGEAEYLETKGIGITKGPINLGTSMRAELKDPDGLTIELRQWFK